MRHFVYNAYDKKTSLGKNKPKLVMLSLLFLVEMWNENFIYVNWKSSLFLLGGQFLVKNNAKSSKRLPLKTRENDTLILYGYFCGLASKYF